MQDQIQSAARWLAKCRLVVVLTGAGVSKESGIPTFRDAQEGLWAQYDPMMLATEAGYLANPALVWQWYDYRFGMVEHAQPNPGHRAIAELGEAVAPGGGRHAKHRRSAPGRRVHRRGGAARQHPQLQVPDRPALWVHEG